MSNDNFFINRPILAALIGIFITVAGVISSSKLAVSEYPSIVPPNVVVIANYPGMSPATIAQTVAAPLERELKGLQDLLYMSSHSTGDGRMTLTLTFKLGVDVDRVLIRVQNAVNNTMNRLPQMVQRLGVTARLASPATNMIIQVSSSESRDVAELANFVDSHISSQLQRLEGVAEVRIFGGGIYAMRVWVDPEKAAAFDLSAQQILAAIKNQNRQVGAGVLGAQPNTGDNAFQLLVNINGGLNTIEKFENIILKGDEKQGLVSLKDVARIELGENFYQLRAHVNGDPAVTIPIFQHPDANALEVADIVAVELKRLEAHFPEDIHYEIIYDTSSFIHHSIDSVFWTLLEATLLVGLVMVLFLRSWRAALIPLLTVPISLIGTFSVMYFLGVSINTLSLFGMVLAIGIVVDDAIVVVENVQRHIDRGITALEATRLTMKEVTAPVISVTVVLCAVFVPTAFIGGVTGEFYRQFALTIAISTVFSTVAALTVAPAFAALLLKAKKNQSEVNPVTAHLDAVIAKMSALYMALVTGLTQRKLLSVALYAAMIGGAIYCYKQVPGEFIPQQDKRYLVAMAKLPDAASLNRTVAVAKKMEALALKVPGVRKTIAFPGLSISGLTNSSNSAVLFIILDEFEDVEGQYPSAGQVAMQINQRLAAIDEGFVAVFQPPVIPGMGTIGGFKLQIQDREGQGYQALFGQLQQFTAAALKDPAIAGMFSDFSIQVPQLEISIDREAVQSNDIRIEDLFETLQLYLGSAYVNDFYLAGRAYQVIMQADAGFRRAADNIEDFTVRNTKGELVPLSSVIRVERIFGPEKVTHYNGYMSAEISGRATAGVASNLVIERLESILNEQLSTGFAFEWTDITYQQQAGDSMWWIAPLCVLLIYMIIAAQYESLRIPWIVVLSVPLVVVPVFAALWLGDQLNNIFTHIGLIVLVGLLCKNTILIIEFAVQQQRRGMLPLDAVLSACQIRLRPVVMTSVTFVAGVFPLLVATGAGAEIRQAVGFTVFYGMLGVTLLNLIFTPVFYVLVGGKAIADGEQTTVEKPLPMRNLV